MTKQSSKYPEWIRISEYLISGGAYFWSGYATFFVLDKGFGLSLWWAKLLANIVGWVINYALQRYWVFRNPSLKKHQTEVTTRYVIITLVDFVLDYLIVAWLKSLGLTPYLGQFVSSGFFTIWNYCWYRWWVFPSQFKQQAKIGKGAMLSRVVAHRAHGHTAYRRA
jgi:putative flippase GtrA